MALSGNGDADVSSDRILDAAERCVHDFGLDRVTVSEIARRARVSRPTIYRRWPDIHAILSAVFTRRVLSILRDVQGGEPRRESIVERSVAAIARLRHDPLVEAGLRAAPDAALYYLSQRLGPGQLALIEVLAVDLKAAQAGGSVRAGDARHLAAMMMVIAQSAIQSACLVEPVLDEAAMDAELRYLLNKYLSEP